MNPIPPRYRVLSASADKVVAILSSFLPSPRRQRAKMYLFKAPSQGKDERGSSVYHMHGQCGEGEGKRKNTHTAAKLAGIREFCPSRQLTSSLSLPSQAHQIPVLVSRRRGFPLSPRDSSRSHLCRRRRVDAAPPTPCPLSLPVPSICRRAKPV